MSQPTTGAPRLSPLSTLIFASRWLQLPLYLGLILVRVLLSFISVERSNPIVPLVFQLTEPVLGPIRKRLPALGGIDFSPMLAWLAIMLARVLVVEPIFDLGRRLALAP